MYVKLQLKHSKIKVRINKNVLYLIYTIACCYMLSMLHMYMYMLKHEGHFLIIFVNNPYT